MSYWDINDFLAEEETISLKFKKKAPGLQFLDSSKDFTDFVPQDEPIDIALWKVATIHIFSNLQDVVEIKVPRFFEKGSGFESIRVRSAQSKPEAANLREQSDYFYHLQALLAGLLTKTVEAAEPIELSQIYANRACNIVAIALKSYNEKEGDLNKPGYTRCELELYKKAFRKNVQNNDWKFGKTPAKR